MSLLHEDILNPSIVRDRKALKLIKEGLIRYLTKEQEKPINEQSIAATIIKAFMDDKANDQRLIYSFNYTDMDAIFSHSNLPSRFNDAIKYVHGCCLKKILYWEQKMRKLIMIMIFYKNHLILCIILQLWYMTLWILMILQYSDIH